MRIRMEGERNITVAVGNAGRDRTKVGLPLSIARRVAGIARVKVDVELIARCGVKRAFDSLGAAGYERRGKNREVLQAIRAAVSIFIVVRCYSVSAEIDAQGRTRSSIRVD